MVQKKTTENERRHAFKSFRERVDSIKIEPNLKLNTRAHDYVETSHFLATLEHWKEVNISGDFIAFIREVESHCQTLAQILHHQAKIYESLHCHIQNNDINSIQPLLELVSQFIHDLGPDFMPYYARYLNLIVGVVKETNPNDSQNMKNTSNVLEWGFNSLAFAFKYLSRTLVVNLEPTFVELLPILLLTKKTYISRFCAEALSFLIKKLKEDSLRDVVKFSFDDQHLLIKENLHYRESLVVLFSEAMKNTRETFHSRAPLILSTLIQSALDGTSRDGLFVSVVCDVLLDVSHHGSIETCRRLYSLTFDYLKEIINSTNEVTNCIAVSQILVTMCFAESGRKIPSWQAVFEVLQLLNLKAQTTEFADDNLKRGFMTSLVHLFVIVIRNCEVRDLTKFFKEICDSALALDNGKYFLSFIESSLAVSSDKMMSFGVAQLLQTHINRISTDFDLLRLSLTYLKVTKSHPQILESMTLPANFKKIIIRQLSENIEQISTDEHLIDLYWRCQVLQFNSKFEDTDLTLFIAALKALCDKDFEKTKFVNDVAGVLLSVSTQCLRESFRNEVAVLLFDMVIQNLGHFRESTVFVRALEQFLVVSSEALTERLKTQHESICLTLAMNLSLPYKQLRELTSNLICKTFSLLLLEQSSVLSQVRLIDQVPLSIANSNDVKMRIRNLVASFCELENPTLLERNSISLFMMGLLSNQFQPCWLAVYEGLPQLHKAGCSGQLWDLLIKFISLDFGNQSELYHTYEPTVFEERESLAFSCQPLDQRIAKSFEFANSTVFISLSQATAAVFEFTKENRDLNLYKPLLRSRMIQALQAIPSVAESHAKLLIELALEVSADNVETDDDDEKKSSWYMKEKLELIGVFGKFKSLRKVPGNEDLFSLLLHQLSSKLGAVQKASLEVIFAWNNQSINKYRDNLKNLLDDKLFRDELQSLVSKSSDSKIEDSDAPAVIPIVLRLLYGRAKGSPKSNSKAGKKFAIASVLPNLPEEYIQQFLFIVSERLDHKSFFEGSGLPEISNQDLKNMVGYLNMLTEIYSSLGYQFGQVLKSTVRPLVFSLVAAQDIIDQGTETGASDHRDKVARTVRQMSMKCLNSLFKLLGDTHDWEQEASLIYLSIFKPRLGKFAEENAQQPSSLMQIMLGWIEFLSLLQFYYFDEFATVQAVMGLLSNPHVKDSVVTCILDFCISALTKRDVADDKYYSVLAIVVNGLLTVLATLIENTDDRDINSKTATLLLLIIEGDYIGDNSTRKSLVGASTVALSKPPTQLGLNDRVSILLSLSSIIDDFDCSLADLEPLYDICSKAFRTYKDRTVRESLVKVFEAIGKRFTEFEILAELLAALNSFSPKRLSEPDFVRRLDAFKTVNETLYSSLSVRHWLPLLYCSLFFINDEEEIALRTNASYTLTRFVDCFSVKASAEEAGEYIEVFNNVVIQYLRLGLKKEHEDVRAEYIGVLAHIVRNSNFVPEFKNMKVLTSELEDDDFFKNISHIQLHCRQKAIRNLIPLRNQLSSDSLYYYILPIIEVYAVCKDERYRNVLDDMHETLSYLARCITWNQFKLLLKKHLFGISRAPDEELRDRVHIVVRLALALHASFKAHSKNESEDVLENYPEGQSQIDNYLMKETFPAIKKILTVRNDQTIVARTPLVEAAVYCLLSVSEQITEIELPGTLTSTCQVLRSRTQHLRDAVRKSLSRIAKMLGSRYFKFIVKELKTALSRGSQIHVLSYTVHSLMVSTFECFESGDLDDSSRMIVDVIMEDIFGAAGQEKDAEDYISKMREVKSKKSYDSAELLSSNISLTNFRDMVEPIKLLLSENVPLRTQRKLDELLRRYALGLNHNPQSSTRDMLMLCYELHKQSTADPSRGRNNREKTVTEAEDHFLVKLKNKPVRMSTDKSQYLFTLQRMAFELMRTALGRHDELLTVSNLDGFIPLIQQSLTSDNEGLLQAVFKLLNLIVKLQFPETRDEFFRETALKSLTIIQNSPTTTSEICQLSLRYIATIVRHKPSLDLKDSAISYVLIKILPDLEEPDRQGLAFNFLKSVISQHIMLAEVYEVMEKVSKIMVVNHSKEIRDMSRSIYFQFLMEYDQGTKKLEKEFKFLVNNLNYPTQAGRQSVMELMHSIVLRSSTTLLVLLGSSFFVGLANVIVSDDSTKCREMATTLITQILKKLGIHRVSGMEKYCQAWIRQDSNSLLQRCGLLVYKIYLSVFGYQQNQSLNEDSLKVIITTLEHSRNSTNGGDVQWEDVYSSLSVFSSICSSRKDEIFLKSFEKPWKLLIDTLLYPHTWVRLISSRLVGLLLSNLEKMDFELSTYEIQTIAYRHMRQLGAPSVAEDLGTQIVKNLIQIITQWEKDDTPFQLKELNDEGEAEADIRDSTRFRNATDFVVSRICGIMRQELRGDTNKAAKISAIQLAAMISQVLTEERLKEVSQQLLLGLFNFTEVESEYLIPEEITNLSKECLKILEDRLGITNFTNLYSTVKHEVDYRRQERRTKRAQLALNAPDVAARRKMRKHERFRDNRKHQRDDNGFYRPKKRVAR